MKIVIIWRTVLHNISLDNQVHWVNMGGDWEAWSNCSFKQNFSLET